MKYILGFFALIGSIIAGIFALKGSNKRKKTKLDKAIDRTTEEIELVKQAQKDLEKGIAELPKKKKEWKKKKVLDILNKGYKKND